MRCGYSLVSWIYRLPVLQIPNSPRLRVWFLHVSGIRKIITLDMIEYAAEYQFQIPSSSAICR